MTAASTNPVLSFSVNITESVEDIMTGSVDDVMAELRDLRQQEHVLAGDLARKVSIISAGGLRHPGNVVVDLVEEWTVDHEVAALQRVECYNNHDNLVQSFTNILAR